MPRLRLHWIFAALLAAATFAIFSRVLDAEFVRWDDDIQITNNARLGPLTWEGVKWAFGDVETAARYIPLTLIGELAGISIAGKKPWIFHLGNLLLHAANAALVFLVLRRLLLLARGNAPMGEGTLVLCAAIGAAFWAWHPLRVEPVAWATTRTYCQCLFFLLISVTCYLNAHAAHARHPAVGPRWGWFIASVVMYAASLLSYPAGLGFAVVLVAIDVCLLGRSPRSARVLLEKLPFVLIAAGALGLALVARLHSSAVFSGTATLAEFGILPRVTQAFYIWSYFAWRPWVPIGISPIYTTLVDVVPTHPRFLLSFVGVLALTVWLISKRKRWPGALALWICHLAMLVPMLGVMEHPHYPADRYSLVVGVIWAAAIAGLLWKWSSDPNRYGTFKPAAAFMVAAIFGLAVMSVRQTAVWIDSRSLFTFMLKRLGDDPYRSDILMRRAVEFAGRGDAAAAEADLRASIVAKPDSPTPHSLLAQVLAGRGNWSEAISECRELVRLRPDDIPAWNMLAVNLANAGRIDEAVSALAEAVVRFPDSLDLRFNLGVSMLNAGRAREAAMQFEQVLARRPDYPQARAALQAAQAKLAAPAMPAR